MKKIFFSVLPIVLVNVLLFFSSCASSRDILYLQGINTPLEEEFLSFSPTIQAGDILAITVNSDNPELSAPFNLPLVSYASTSGKVTGNQHLQGSLVDNEGMLTFPLLGKIKAGGLTKQQLISLIEGKLKEGGYLKEPIVTIAFKNFKVSVLGEVGRPGSFSIENERVTLFDAIGMAGDLSIYGRRDNVLVVREENGKRIIYSHDLRSPDIFKSPAYYLHQNDVIIVSPNETRAQMAGINQNSNVGVWISVIGATTSVAALIATLLKK